MQATKEAEHREKLSDLRARVDACKERYNLENNAYHKAQVASSDTHAKPSFSFPNR